MQHVKDEILVRLQSRPEHVASPKDVKLVDQLFVCGQHNKASKEFVADYRKEHAPGYHSPYKPSSSTEVGTSSQPIISTQRDSIHQSDFYPQTGTSTQTCLYDQPNILTQGDSINQSDLFPHAGPSTQLGLHDRSNVLTQRGSFNQSNVFPQAGLSSQPGLYDHLNISTHRDFIDQSNMFSQAGLSTQRTFLNQSNVSTQAGSSTQCGLNDQSGPSTQSDAYVSSTANDGSDMSESSEEDDEGIRSKENLAAQNGEAKKPANMIAPGTMNRITAIAVLAGRKGAAEDAFSAQIIWAKWHNLVSHC